jgi:hypothetical protein
LLIVAPAESAVEYIALNFDSGFGPTFSPFVATPSPEVDAAWLALYSGKAQDNGIAALSIG